MKTVSKMLEVGIFPMFDNIFTAKILGMWEKRGFTTPPSPMHYHNGLFHKKKKQGGGGGGLRTYFFEKPLEFLGLCFALKFQTK